jgi:hypothetical protein
MVRVLIYIVAGMLLCSCKNHEGNNGMHKTEIPFAHIKNESLVREIRLYINRVNTPTLKNKIVQVRISQFEDTTVYKLYYATSAFGLIITPSTFYTKVDEEVIAFSYDGVQEIGLSESLAWEYLKEVFPEEFNYYQVNNDYPPPPTSRGVFWILTFKEGKLIEKQEIIN